MVLRGNLRKRIGLVAVFLEIAVGDHGKDIDEGSVLAAFFLEVACLGQYFADGAPEISVIFSTPTQSTIRAFFAAMAFSP
jgi:hypothetical protein